jgi:hypothetical protein
MPRSRTRPSAPVPRYTLTRREAAASLGISINHFERRVQPELKVVISGQLILIPMPSSSVGSSATRAGWWRPAVSATDRPASAISAGRRDSGRAVLHDADRTGAAQETPRHANRYSLRPFRSTR